VTPGDPAASSPKEVEMAAREVYTITSWEVTGVGPIPLDGFKEGDILSSEQPDVRVRARKLSWRDGACSIESLPFDIPSPVVDVIFETGSVPCYVELVRQNGKLEGTLRAKLLGVGDGNTGTFAADAHPGIDGSA
jgi:hypothetical protein